MVDLDALMSYFWQDDIEELDQSKASLVLNENIPVRVAFLIFQ